MSDLSLQEKFAPHSICFGCGPANKDGLKIKSFVNADGLICDWKPSPHHEAFPGMLNGGIIGALLDCHCNWTAAWTLLTKFNLKDFPCTVTAEYTIKLLRPTPSALPLQLKSRAIEVVGNDRVHVAGELLTSGGKVTAQCKGLFVAVKAGHPAYHRWG